MKNILLGGNEMNCFYHPDRAAVSVCTHCGKGLCQECALRYKKLSCSDCAVSAALDVKSKLEKAYLLSALLFLVALISIFSVVEVFHVYQIAAVLLFSCFPFGWYALTRITPRMFVFLPVLGWIIYFYIKFILSCCIGPFVFLFRILRDNNFVRNVRKAEIERSGVPPFDNPSLSSAYDSFFQEHDAKPTFLIIGCISLVIGGVCLAIHLLFTSMSALLGIAAFFISFGAVSLVGVSLG